MDRLILQYREQKNAIEQCGDRRDVLLGNVVDPANDIRDAIDQPVRSEDGNTGYEFRKMNPVFAHWLNDGSQPEIVIQVAGENSEDLQLKPLAAKRDQHNANREYYASAQRIHIHAA